MDNQVRTFDIRNVEIREAEGGGRMLVGHAAVFGVNSRVIGGRFVERIERGAFRRAIEEGQDVRALNQHDAKQILGRTKSGTLRLVEDDIGLRIENDLPRTTYADDLVEQVRRGDIDQMSFAFRAAAGGERYERGAGPDGVDLRVLTDVDLFDVSPVTFAAYEETALALRSYAEHFKMPGVDRYVETVEDATDAPTETRSCFRGHMGLYLMEPDRLIACVDSIRAGITVPRSRQDLERAAGRVFSDPKQDLRAMHPGASELTDEEVRLFSRKGIIFHAGGIAEIPIEGALSKRFSKYADDWTQRIRGSLQHAVAHEKVRGVMLRIDSPGGEASGTAELADDVREAEKVKPVHVFVDDMAASAGYWIASGAGRITVNRTGEVGSIGVYGVVYDREEQYRREGVKVHVISTGPDKGQGVPGTAVTQKYLDRRAEDVGRIHDFFVEAVSGGRGIAEERVRELATGRMYGAERALELGLVDAVGALSEAFEVLRSTATSDTETTAPDPGESAVDPVEPPADKANPPMALRSYRQKLARFR